MTVLSVTAGGTTDHSAVVVGQVSGVSSVRLAVDTSEAMPAPSFTDAQTPTAQGMVRFAVTNLTNGRYFYQLETDSVLDGEVGQFRTHPPLGQGNSDVLIAAAGDAGRTPDAPGVAGSLIPSRISNNPVHTLIADMHDPLMFFMLGDECYYNIGSGETWPDGNGDPIVLNDDLDTYRRQYEDTFLQPHQAYLARRVAREHVWDDHEFGGGPDVGSDRTLPGRDNACLAYREWEPYEDLPAPAGANPVYHHTQIDRTLYVFLDTRADRDPNDDPPSPTKTMLGTAQRAWLDDLLTNSTAEALVIVSSSSWLGVGADSWASYEHEQAQLVQLFTDTGFIDRMVLLTANTHFLAIDDGSNNDHGGFPVYVFAPLDSSPTTSSAHDYPLGFQPAQSGQYGTLRVVDTGDTIQITGTGWLNDSIWNAHTHTVNVGEDPDPDPDPEPPPGPGPGVARPRIRRQVAWFGVHATTGRIIAELPDVRGDIGRLLSAYHSSNLTIPIPLSGPAHLPIRLIEQATQPISTGIVAVVNDLPVWEGWVLSRKGGTGAKLQLACVTPEGYLRRRRVRNHNVLERDRALVAADLIGDAEDIDGVGAGLGFDLDVTLTGETVTRTYLRSDRTRVYDALRELAAAGLEFTVDLDWQDADMTSIRRILRIGPRVGRAETRVLFETAASSLFESRAGSEATYDLTEDAAEGRYATWVEAYGPGEGEDQPTSQPAIDQVALAGGAPIVERHVQASDDPEISTPALNTLAVAELARVRRGAEIWDISVRLDAYPRLGVDVAIGDDVSWLLTGHRHPDGVMGAGRMIGWKLNQQAGRWSPVLLDPQEA